MSNLLFLAAILSVLLGLAHSVLGEKYILVRLFRRADLPKLFGDSWFTIRTLRFAWHLTSVLWFGFAALLVHAGRGDLTTPGTLRIIGITSIASAALPLVITRGRHLSWVVLLAIGAIALACAD